MNQHPNDDWAAEHALDAILGDQGRDEAAVLPAGWLNTLLDEIDASPEIKVILEKAGPDRLEEMLNQVREMSNGLMTAVLLVHPHDKANLGYQAAAALRREILADGIPEGDNIVIERLDYGPIDGYWLSHEKAGGGRDYWEFDNQGRPLE